MGSRFLRREIRQLESGRVKHGFEPLALVLSLLMLPAVLLSDTRTDPSWRPVGNAIGALVWVAFMVELGFIWYHAPDRRRALKVHWADIAVVILICPLWQPIAVASGSAALIRLARLVRLTAVAGRIFRADRLLSSRKSLHYAASLVALIVVGSGIAVSETDPSRFPNPWRGVWWAMVTSTTVGYGDVVPSSPLGRIVAVCLMLVGIGFLSLLTASVAAKFMEQSDAGASSEILHELRKINARLDAIDQRLEGTERS